MSAITVQRHYSYPLTVDLYVMACGQCGIVFGMPTDFKARRREDRETFYCPNGHPRVFTGKTDAQKQRERADAAESRANSAEATAKYQRERAEAARRSASAYKGQLTKIRNRIIAGVCPVPGCKRTGLTQTMRHIEQKHPSWHAEHAAEL